MDWVPIIGVITPIIVPEVSMKDMARLRSFCGNQLAIPFDADGKKLPSPNPKRNRMSIKDMKDHAIPDKIVKTDQAKTAMIMIFRKPNRSASHPPGICIKA